MANRNERMEKLNNAGVNTTKYFNLDLPNGLKPGAKIQLIINENGEPMVVSDNHEDNTVFNNDYIAEQIITDGYVRNTKLHRRFVMAQMFHMLNYVSYSGRERGYNAYLKNAYGYNYTLEMMCEEIRVLSKLEVRDRESFAERSHFFTKDVVVSVLEDYVGKLKEYVNNMPDRKCKGIPYKRIKGTNIFNEDLNKRIYLPIERDIRHIRYANNYNEIYRIMCSFMRNMINLPYETPKSKIWTDAFKGEGAFYTMKNLVMFHNCTIYTGPRDTIIYRRFDGAEAVRYLSTKLDEYQGEGWRMFAMMKKLIADNDFDFNERMREIGYSK